MLTGRAEKSARFLFFSSIRKIPRCPALKAFHNGEGEPGMRALR
jgi:hypothetical protein